MFGISFSELVVIAVVALLVVGPEKLPKLARTVGAFVGRMQRYVDQVKEEVNREMRFEELKNLQQEIKHTVEHTEESIYQKVDEVKNAVTDAPKAKQVTKVAPRNSTAKPPPSKTKVSAKSAKVVANDDA